MFQDNTSDSEITIQKAIPKSPPRRKSIICSVTNQNDVIQEEHSKKCQKCTSHHKCNSCNMKSHQNILSALSNKTLDKRPSQNPVSKNFNFRNSICSPHYNISDVTGNFRGITINNKTEFYKCGLDLNSENERRDSFLPTISVFKDSKFKLRSLLFSKTKFLQTDSTRRQTGSQFYKSPCLTKNHVSKEGRQSKHYEANTLSRRNYSNALTTRNTNKIKRKTFNNWDGFVDQSPNFHRRDYRYVPKDLERSIMITRSKIENISCKINQHFDTVLKKFNKECVNTCFV